MLNSFGHFAQISLAKAEKSSVLLYQIFSSEHADSLPQRDGGLGWGNRARDALEKCPPVWSAVGLVIWIKDCAERANQTLGPA